MKKLILIICLFISINSFAQKPIDTISFAPMDLQLTTITIGVVCMDTLNHKNYIVVTSNDSADTNIFQPKNLEIYGDTIQNMLSLLEELQKQNEALYAAEQILSNITLNGQVSDWKAFYKSVANYRKLKGYKP